MAENVINPYPQQLYYYDPSLEGPQSQFLSEQGLKFMDNQWVDAGGNVVNAADILKDQPFSIGGLSGGDLLKGAMGVGQLGLGVASFLDQKKTAGKQRELMNQQIGQNKFLLDQARGRQADIGKAFGGSGLAASSV